MKITVMGLGGIGGLLSGPLVRRYGGEVSLIARGARAQHLRREGLTLHSDYFGEFTVRPTTVTADPAELPVQDLVIVCVKNGQLADAARQLAPVVGPETVLLTVMNGVTAGDVLRRELGRGIVLESVIYTVASAGRDFSITQTGNFTHLFTGARGGDSAGGRAAAMVDSLFQEAGIDCRLTDDVDNAIWSKYVFNCAYNVATARWGCTIGGIKADESRVEDCRALLTESWKVGVASGVALPEELPEKQLRRILKTSDDSDSSLGRDFAAGRAGELEVFCGDVIRMAAEYGVDVPMTQKYYDALKDIASRF